MAMKHSFSFLSLFENIIKLCKVDSVADTEVIILLLNLIELILNFIVHRQQWLDIQDKQNSMETLYQYNYIIHFHHTNHQYYLQLISFVNQKRFSIVLAETNCGINAYFHSVHSGFFNNKVPSVEHVFKIL